MVRAYSQNPVIIADWNHYRAHMKRFLNYSTKNTVNFSSDTIFGCSWVNSVIVFLLNALRGNKDRSPLPQEPFLGAFTLSENEKKKKTSWVCVNPHGCFVWKDLKVAHRWSAVRQQNLECEINVACQDCSINALSTAQRRPQSLPFLLQLRFFFFLYLGKMSIGCFYVLWPVSHKMWHDRGFLFYLFPAVYHLGAGKDALWLSLVRYTSICAPIVRNWEGYWEWCLSVGGVDWCMKPNLKYPVDYVRTSRKERIHHYLCFHFLQSLCVIFFFKEDGV